MSENKTVTLADIIGCIEDFASPGIQEEWDNTGVQILPVSGSTPCTGAMVCLDVTPEVVAEAKAEGCNLIISHHPLIFNPLRQISLATHVGATVIAAISAGITVYSSHTALDSASAGVSHKLGTMLGLSDMRVLDPQPGSFLTGLGVVGSYREPLPVGDFIERVKEVYGAPVVRCSEGPSGLETIRRVALCSGAGSGLIRDAIASLADAYVTSDTGHHYFVDYGKDILMVDTGHFESEICTKSIFSDIISEKFPTFAVRQSRAEQNPVRYV